MLWVGDFNRHHLLWDDPNDTRLFTNEAIKAAEVLIEGLVETGMVMALPGGTQMHLHNTTKKWTRLDQVFITEHSENLLLTCDTLPDHTGIKTDHLPILTELNLTANIVEETPPPTSER
jgi:endonuclease/exonuclease/phosphatase family metal-dependent hydrolase